METWTGIGYRRDFAEHWQNKAPFAIDFVEIAPENWMGMGGASKRQLQAIAAHYPIFCHGLSLSIGGPDPLDTAFLKKLKAFLDAWQVPIYSEHLSFSTAKNAHLFDLLPIPFQKDAVSWISQRIQQVQEELKRPLILENVSYYTAVNPEMSEAEFLNEIVKKSGCKLLLDVNNVYVNAFNHQYNPEEFISKLPLDSVVYIHMAGHEKVSDSLILDTHGQAVIPDVFELLEFTLKKLNRSVPVLLERDFNMPEMEELEEELIQIKSIQNQIKENSHAALS